jgi:PTH1 family peptidyl-tRNA hydrolase
LGNPGPAYAVTRHNAGFILGDFLAKEWQFPKFRRVGRATVTDDIVRGEPVAIVKPRTYMNLSGKALGPLRAVPAFDMSRDMLVVVDDYAIPIGTFRMRARGSAGGHNGLRSIEDAINTQEYARLRVGVGPLPEDGTEPSEFVLSPMTAEEVETLAQLLPILADAVECWVHEGIEPAMNRFNRKDVREAE